MMTVIDVMIDVMIDAMTTIAVMIAVGAIVVDPALVRLASFE
jgi:hypothetical protein